MMYSEIWNGGIHLGFCITLTEMFSLCHIFSFSLPPLILFSLVIALGITCGILI